MEEDKKQDEETTIEAEGSATDLQDKVAKLKEKIALCLKEKQEYLDGWQRARADYANARKAEEKQKAEFALRVQENILSDILPVIDSFELAFAGQSSDQNWRRGIEGIYSQLLGILQSYGLESFGAPGEKFDPEFHEAIDAVSVESQEKNDIIMAVASKGYKINGRVLRPAKVKVGKYNMNNLPTG